MAYRIVVSDNFEDYVVRAQRFLMNSTDDGLFERIDRLIDRLDEEMESTVNDLMRFPEMFPVAFKDMEGNEYRSALIHNFRYRLIYTISKTEQKILLVSLISTREFLEGYVYEL